MPRPSLIKAIGAVLIAVVTGAAGYAWGVRVERERMDAWLQDYRLALRLNRVERDLSLLTGLREKKADDWISQIELEVSVHLSEVDPSRLTEDSAAKYMFKRVAPLLSEYRKRYPETALDASRNPKLAKVLNAI